MQSGIVSAVLIIVGESKPSPYTIEFIFALDKELTRFLERKLGKELT